jgi:hypothetical protein
LSVIYEPHIVFWPLSKVNSISSEKSTTGWRGPIPWAPKFQDLTPHDFYIWRYVKDLVYQPPMQHRPQPMSTSQELWHACENFEYHFDICRLTNGAHTEHLLINFVSFHSVFKLFHVWICNHLKNYINFLSPNSFITALYQNKITLFTISDIKI